MDGKNNALAATYIALGIIMIIKRNLPPTMDTVGGNPLQNTIAGMLILLAGILFLRKPNR